ncbi:hypothetical protein Gohar_024668 [Gossypium harknessii]|uniref:Dof zinc finger protein n=1 Tax=Gossypium harknessii TaxID=34285 RepID=A0A7J9HJ91_9ROSI|nr:hypothetical protein [Gossypium harknessii]
MVFSSLPSYLDPPNWQQRPPFLQQPGVITSENHHNSQLPPPAPPSAGGGAGGIRPGSMVERARLAKIPHPASALKCPRCESTNTKFCYFNNYSLSQPRHFCKTCRRYWTRGGALRNVPVGGGCRRNKRSKGRKRSKSPSVTSERQTGSSSSATTINSNGCTEMLSHVNPAAAPQLPPLAPLHHLGDYNSGDIEVTFGDETRIMSSNGVGLMLPDWRSAQQVQQFPFLTSLDHPQTGLYSFVNETMEPTGYAGQQQLLGSKPLEITIIESSAVKMEETPSPWLNPSRNFLGNSGNDDQYWFGGGGNPWTDLSGFTSSSITHFF